MNLLASSNLIFKAFYSSDLFGKGIFLGLFLLSLVSWFILIQKTWTLHQIKKTCKTYGDLIHSNKDQILKIDKKLLPRLISKEIVNPYHSIYFTLKEKTLDLLKKNQFFSSQQNEYQTAVFLSKSDISSIEEQLYATLKMQIKIMEQNLFILSTIVSLAPFLGILGTVWGILISLFEMQSAQSAQSSSVILSGLSTALATTVLGLVIAIPALICYNYLKNVIKQLVFDMEHFGHDLITNIELQYRKVEL